MAQLLIATGNPHKVEEIRAIFAAQAGGTDSRGTGIGVELLTLADLDTAIPEAVEDCPTFEDNAEKKARHYAAASGLMCLADDSGLEVDALGGDPGVRSARYAGVTGPRAQVDLANNRKLLELLRDVPIPQRTARFVCAMVLCDPTAVLASVRGTVEGRMLTEHETEDASQPERGRGGQGFGYDPLFLVSELGMTTAQLPPEHKNRISHRGAACRLMWEHLCRLKIASIGRLGTTQV